MASAFSLTGSFGQKVHVFREAVRQVRNWPEVVGLRIRSRKDEIRVLRFRDGLQLACRGGNLDWAVLTTVLFEDTYRRALAHLKACVGNPAVFDLGANIGFFSLLAAQAHTSARVFAYEPAPPNLRMVELNRSLN